MAQNSMGGRESTASARGFVGSTSASTRDGRTAIAVIIGTQAGDIIARLTQVSSEARTNIGAVRAIALAVEHCRERGWGPVEVQSAADVAIGWIDGSYRIREGRAVESVERARRALRAHGSAQIVHVSEDLVAAARSHARRALDAEGER